MSAARGVVVGPEEGVTIRSPLGGDARFVLRGSQTGGSITVLEVTVPPGQGPPLHVHAREDETMQVLAGSFRWKLGDELFTGSAGSYVFIPRGTAHCFQNAGPDIGRMLITFSPAGMERFFERMARAATLDIDAFRAAAAEDGMDVVGPPLGAAARP